MILKSSMAGENVGHRTFVSEDKPPYEKDEFEIGAEGDNNDFFHVNESAHADLDYINSISYTIETDEDGNEYYDGEVYDNDGHHLDFFYGDREDIEYYFQDNLNVAEKIFNKDAMKRGNFYWIEDLQDEFINDMNVNINNVDSVNKAAKRLSKPNGASLFILTDGSIISFHDHSQIQSVCDGMTISRFLELGNIRCGGVNVITIQLIQQPTFEQMHCLKRMLSNADEVFVDFAVPNKNDNMYPETIHSVSYIQPNESRVVNDIMYYFIEGIKPLGENKEDENNAINENLESEVEASEVKLDSFKKNDTLAPKIWNDFELNPKVRLRLLDIADDFWDFANVTWVKRDGIHLTGSICNFNWSKFSDIDLHIVVDFSKIDERTDFVQEYFDGKKNEWNNEHAKLKIYGYPVELYVEDIHAETASNGLYDLEENKWIKKPSIDNIKQIGLNKYEIKSKSAKLMTSIDDLYDEFNSTDDDAKLREIGEKAHKLLNKIKRMRKFGLQRNGESDALNVIYKVLRRSGYMEMLWGLSSELYDKINSLGINESLIKEDYDIFELAKQHFGVTNDIRECGYILPDGLMLDFSGTHERQGKDSSFLKGRRNVDHREIESLKWKKDGFTRSGIEISMPEFIKMGAIRIHASSTYSTINLYVKPTEQQIDILLRIIRYSNGCVVLEIGDGYDESLSYAEYDNAKPRKIVNDIIRYFDEGINLIGNVSESKVIGEYYKKFIHINEEIVADGSAEHNPFKERWKHEREMLKNYLVNYGEIMTSKENGKEYKVLYDSFISGRLGTNFCICIQWNSLTMEPGNVIYVRAYDKFTKRRFKPQFDTRGYDNQAGTADDVV